MLGDIVFSLLKRGAGLTIIKSQERLVIKVC